MTDKILGWLKVIDRINISVASVICYLEFLLMIFMCWEVFSRYVFNMPTSWSMELTQFIFLIMIALGGGWGLIVGSHVNVDVLYGRFNARNRGIISVFTYLFLLGFSLFLFSSSWSAALLSFQYAENSGSGWNPSLWPVKFIIPLGALMLFFQSLASFIRYIIQAMTGIEQIHEHGISIEETF
jgi:TRAP-type mannitol/chloroaromatic compound transport system permease small subunit